MAELDTEVESGPGVAGRRRAAQAASEANMEIDRETVRRRMTAGCQVLPSAALALRARWMARGATTREAARTIEAAEQALFAHGPTTKSEQTSKAEHMQQAPVEPQEEPRTKAWRRKGDKSWPPSTMGTTRLTLVGRNTPRALQK